MAEGNIEVYESEDRTFPPSPEFAAAARPRTVRSTPKPTPTSEAFWARQAASC
ncbi:MAG: hypothetical protein R2695_21780 [Acidimicrobiales bacterium]